MIKNIFALLLALTISVSSYAQLKYEKRIELEDKDGYSGEKIYEFGENGFILRSYNREKQDKMQEWRYELYNTDIESELVKTVLLPKQYFADETYTNTERIHTLFKDRKGNYTLVTVNATSLEVDKATGVIPKKSVVKEMTVFGDFAYFNAYIKGAPFLFSINWKTGTQKPIPVSIPGFKPKQIKLDNFQFLEKSQEIMLYTTVKLSKTNSDTYVIQLDDKGNKVHAYNLTKNINENIIDISAFNIGDGNYVFTGTYATESRYSSEGIFFCKASGDQIENIEFHKFLDLNNFLSYLSEKRQAKIEKKKKKKESKGKEYKLNYKIANHDIITVSDGYIVLGEAYYATHRREAYTTTQMVNGVSQTVTRYRTVFDGYQYTHAVIAKFDLEGKLVWDETFEMYPSYKPYRVQKFISIAEQNDESLNMVFSSSNKIVGKIIDFNGNIIQERESSKIETNYEGDKQKWAYSDINYWYDDYFLAYGKQRIKNKTNKDVKKKRTVYFITKVKFEEEE